MAVTHAGYDQAGRFSRIVGDFTVPRMSCGPNSPAGFVAVWIGIHGQDGLEQCGVSAWCSGGQRRASVWYEDYPEPPKNFTIPVAQGNRMHASVEIRASSVVYVMKNVTQGRQQTITTQSDREPGERNWYAEARGTPPPFAEIDFWKAGGFPSGLSSTEMAPFDLGPISGSNFWIRDAR